MRIIPTRIHGILDYVVALLLIFSPTIFMYGSDGGPGVYAPEIVGVLLFVYSLLTRYELGALKVIHFAAHLVIDFFLAAFLILSPFLFQLTDQGPNIWLPNFITGIVILGFVLFSKTIPDDRSPDES